MKMLAVFVKEVKELIRDPIALAMIIALPIMEIILFGYAIEFKVRGLPLAVFYSDYSMQARDIVQKLENTGIYKVKFYAQHAKEVKDLVDSGKAKAGIIFFSSSVKDLKRNRGTIRMLIDVSDPLVASAAMAGAGILQHSEAKVWNVRVEELYSPDSTRGSKDFVVPGVLGMIICMTCLMLASLAVVREKEDEQIQQIYMAPISLGQYMTGKMFPYFLISTVQIVGAAGLAYLLFSTEAKGSMLAFFSLVFLLCIVYLGIGALISLFFRTRQQATMVAFFSLFPNFLLTGFLFPLIVIPRGLRLLSYSIPFTYFMDGIRSVTMKGLGFYAVVPEIGILLLFFFGIIGIVAAVITAKIY